MICQIRSARQKVCQEWTRAAHLTFYFCAELERNSVIVQARVTGGQLAGDTVAVGAAGLHIVRAGMRRRGCRVTCVHVVLDRREALAAIVTLIISLVAHMCSPLNS